jgi:hypothetical protein
MSNPYAPPTSTELPAAAGEPPRSTRHWFWKVYAVAFAAELLFDTRLFLTGRMPPQALLHQAIRVLACVGVLAYAFSKKIGRRWLWRQIWWVFPLSELILYLTEKIALERLFASFPGVYATSSAPLTTFFVPLTSLALYRFSRSRIWT